MIGLPPAAGEDAAREVDLRLAVGAGAAWAAVLWGLTTSAVAALIVATVCAGFGLAAFGVLAVRWWLEIEDDDPRRLVRSAPPAENFVNFVVLTKDFRVSICSNLSLFL